jgi:hypothetical protein
MLLRDHPLMSHYGVPNWPPVWTWIDRQENKSPTGEVGILKWVGLTGFQPPDRCYLYIDHEASTYPGCPLFDHHEFCRYVAKLLDGYCNHSIVEIGSLDLSHTF